MASITSLGFSIFSRYNGSGVREARNDIQRLNNELTGTNGALNLLARSFGRTASNAVLLGPALMPVAASLTAVVTAAASIGTIAGAGLGIFGVALAGAVKQVQTMKASTGELSTDLNLQKTILGQLTPGTDAYEKQLKKVAVAQDRYNHALAAASAPQAAFLKSMNGMSFAWNTFLEKTSSGTLGVASTAIDTISIALDKMAPLVNAISPLIQAVADRFKAWASGSGLDRFIDLVLKYGVPAIQSMMNTLNDLGAVLGFAMRDFAGMGLSLVQTLEAGAKALRGWAEGGGFQRFLESTNITGPMVVEFLKALKDALVKVLKAAAKIGPVVLEVVTRFLQLIAAMPTEALIALWVAFAAFRGLKVIVAAMEAMSLFLTSLAISCGAAAVAEGTMTGAQWALNAAVAAFPVFLIIAAIVAFIGGIILMYKKVEWFRDAWDAAWAWCEVVFRKSWDWIVATAKEVWGWLVERWQDTVDTIVVVWGWLRDRSEEAMDKLAGAWNFMWEKMEDAWDWFYDKIVVPIGDTIQWLKDTWDQAYPKLVDLWTDVWDTLTGIWNKFYDTTATIIHDLFDWIKDAWDKSKDLVVTVWGSVWDTLKVAWDLFYDVVIDPIKAALDKVKDAWNNSTEPISNLWSGLWDGLTKAWNTFDSTVLEAIRKVLNTIKGAWDIWYPEVKKAWDNLWGALKGAWEIFDREVLGMVRGALGDIKDWWDEHKDSIITIWNGLWGVVKQIWDEMYEKVIEPIGKAISWINENWNKDGQLLMVVGMIIAVGITMLFLPLIIAGGILYLIAKAINWISEAWNSDNPLLRFSVHLVVDIITAPFKLMWMVGKGIFWLMGHVIDWIAELWRSDNPVLGFVVDLLVGTVTLPFKLLWQAGSGVFWLVGHFIEWVSGLWSGDGERLKQIVSDLFMTIAHIILYPFQLVIDVVWNNAIVKPWNLISGLFSGPQLSPFSLPTFAEGGQIQGKGTGTSDSIVARLSHGEHVWTAKEVQAAGGHEAVMRMRSQVLGGSPVRGAYDGTGFSLGGWIADTVGSAISNLKSAALGKVSDTLAPMVLGMANTGKNFIHGLIPGEPLVEKMVDGLVDKPVATFLNWVKGKDVAPVPGGSWDGTIDPGAIGEMQKWALGQQGGQYLWGGVGSMRMDCSGMVGNLWAIATGQRMYQRYMTTANMGPGHFGMEPGAGNFTVYLKQSGPGGGHTAANVGGLHVEAYGGDGTPFAIGHVGTPLSYYDQTLHMRGLAKGGPVDVKKLKTHSDVMASFLNTGWPEMYGLGTFGANSGLKIVGDKGPELVRFRGGESVMTNDATKALVGRGAGGGDVVVNMPVTVNGNMDSAAVDRLESVLVPNLRRQLQQQVGRRNR